MITDNKKKPSELVNEFIKYFYDNEVRTGHCSGFSGCEVISIEMFAEWLDEHYKEMMI